MQPGPGMFDVRFAVAAYRTQALSKQVQCPTSNRLVVRVVLSEFKEQTEQRQGNRFWGVRKRVHRFIPSGDVQRIVVVRAPVGTSFRDFVAHLFRKQMLAGSQNRERISYINALHAIGNATDSLRKVCVSVLRTCPLCAVLSQLEEFAP